ncbi:Outer dense fiber protein 2 [Lemmus lemmus]
MALKDTIAILKTVKQMACTYNTTLIRQKELLLQKLSSSLETICALLRDQLMEEQINQQLKDYERLMKLEGALLKQLVEADSEKVDLCIAEVLELWRSYYNQVVKDKGDLELEIIVLNDRVADLQNQQQSLEEKMLEEQERLHRQTSEISAFKLENEKLKV